MKKILIAIIIVCLSLGACQDLVEDINDNPNEPTDVPAELLLRGMMLGDVSVQASHLQRIAGMWSGQYRGLIQLYGSLYQYNLTSEESNDTWLTIYQGVVKQGRVIRENIPEDNLHAGITKILEAHVVGTAAVIYGNIPYSQVADDEIEDPVFDSQLSVYQDLQGLLDEAINDLSEIENVISLDTDIFFGGDHNKWIEVAYTLKARYFMQMKDYAQAYAAAQNGISTPENSMKFYPLGVIGNGDANLLNSFISERGGFMTTEGTYLEGLLDIGNPDSRNNAKTNEEARAAYFAIEGSSASSEEGVAAITAPMPLVIYEENLLILAEAGTRTQNLAAGLQPLNTLRDYLNSGEAFPMLADSLNLVYEPYVAADFNAGGIENPGGMVPTRALLKEIVEERYVSGYGQFIPFNDARRLRKDDSDIAVSIPFNTPTATQYPERFIISQEELNANSNAPDPDPGIYAVTEVNQ